MTEQTMMLATYSIGDGDFTELVCQSCAENFADDMGLTWNDSVTHTIDDAKAYASWEPYGEADSVATCSACHAILDTSLTKDGLAWLSENRDGFPAWLLAYHLGDDHCQHPAPASFGASQVRDGVLVHDCAECGLVMAWTIS